VTGTGICKTSNCMDDIDVSTFSAYFSEGTDMLNQLHSFPVLTGVLGGMRWPSFKLCGLVGELTTA
jgi:hypothetical protein